MRASSPLRRLGLGLLIAATLSTLVSTTAQAEPKKDRASAAGYFRIMARPDLDGGSSRLGLWNISGRLLNEGPWAALELKLDVLPQTLDSQDIWTSVHAKIEGGSVRASDSMNGSLQAFNLTQLYVKAGNVLFEDTTWQLGTLHTYFGDLGLYDMKPSDLFWETIGLSLTYSNDTIDAMVGLGDSGYGIRGSNYSTILTAGGSLRARIADGFEVGVGGQFNYEPGVEGNRYAPHKSPLNETYFGTSGDVRSTYEDFVRGEIVEQWALHQSGLPTDTSGLPGVDEVVYGDNGFPNPESTSAHSYKVVAYLGFGKLGPLKWNNLFANFTLLHPENFVTETYRGTEVPVYVTELTDQRYQINVGDEMQLTVIDGVWDIVWGALFGLPQ